jgi:glycine/D-amino acid oxidase-like deaminating enzyme
MTFGAAASVAPAVRPGALANVRVVVVGAGVVGASIARAAVAAGAHVTIVEAGTAGRSGASALPAALINPHRGRSGRAHPDDLAGAAAFWRWHEAFTAAGVSAAVRGGVVRIAADARQARAWGALDGVEALPAGRLGPFRLPHGGFRVRDAGWVDPQAWITALLAAARAGGARLHEGERVERLERRGSGHLVLTASLRVEADIVALCLGATPPGALPGLPYESVAGEVALARHPALPHAVAGAVYAAAARAPEHGPVVAVGGNHRPAGSEVDARAEARRLLASLRWALPDLAAEPVDVWTGVRARAEGGTPIIREVAPGTWWVGAFAGRGFLRAASVAEELVRLWAEACGGRSG